MDGYRLRTVGAASDAVRVYNAWDKRGMGGAWRSHRDKIGHDEGEYCFIPDPGGLPQFCLQSIQAAEQLKLKPGCQVMCLVQWRVGWHAHSQIQQSCSKEFKSSSKTSNSFSAS